MKRSEAEELLTQYVHWMVEEKKAGTCTCPACFVNGREWDEEPVEAPA